MDIEVVAHCALEGKKVATAAVFLKVVQDRYAVPTKTWTNIDINHFSTYVGTFFLCCHMAKWVGVVLGFANS